MSAFLSREEELTMLIESLFDSIERECPAIFSYGNVSLRSVLERYFYFSALSNPVSLKPLLDATVTWYKDTRDNELKACYRQKAESIKYGIRDRFNYYLSFFINLSRLFFHSAINRLINTKVNNKVNGDDRPIAFFAFSDRFVFFFKDVVSEINPEKCIFLSINGLVSIEVVSQLKARLVKPEHPVIRWSDIKIKLGHPLYLQFLIALKKYTMSEEMLINYKPKVLIFAEGTSMDDQAMALAARSLGIPTVRLQSGRAGIPHTGYRNMAFDKMLCWGEGFVKRFQRYSPDSQYVITGSPLMDNISNIDDLDNLRCRTVVFFTQPVSTYISVDDYMQLIELAKRLLSKYEDINILVRKHPVDQRMDFDELVCEYNQRMKMMNIESATLAEVLCQSDIAVGFYSTTLSEAAAYGVIPVILKLSDQHSVFPYPEKYGAAVETSGIDMAEAWIAKIVYHPESVIEIKKNMNDFASEYFGPRDGLAMDRIVKSIKKTIEENISDEKS